MLDASFIWLVLCFPLACQHWQ